jgi:hypothetical protein
MDGMFDLKGAREAGASDNQIADFLAQQHGFDIQGARDAGASNTQIADFLANREIKPTKPTKPEKQILSDEDTSSDLLRGLKNVPGAFQETYGAAKAVTGLGIKKLGFEETGTDLMKSGLATMEKGEAAQVGKATDEFTHAWDKGIYNVITDWLPYQIGAGVGNLAETAAFMLAGAGIGAVTGAGIGAAPGALAGVIEKTLIKQGIKTQAEKILKDQGVEAAKDFTQDAVKKTLIKMGTEAGIAGQAVTHGVGEVGGRAFTEAEKEGNAPESIDLSKVLPAAALHSVADFIVSKISLGALKPIEGREAGNLVTDILKQWFITGSKELPPELIQTAAERYGANLSLSDADAIKDYINTAAASYGMSLVPGATGAVRTRLGASPTTDTTEDQKEIETGTKLLTHDPLSYDRVAPYEMITSEDGTTFRTRQEYDEYKRQERIANQQANQEERNINEDTGTDEPPTGGGINISGEPNQPGAGNTSRDDNNGLDSTEDNGTAAGTGENEQRPPLNEEDLKTDRYEQLSPEEKNEQRPPLNEEDLKTDRYEQLSPEEKNTAMQRAEELWRNKTVGLDERFLWDNLPEWKKELYAAQVHFGEGDTTENIADLNKKPQKQTQSQSQKQTQKQPKYTPTAEPSAENFLNEAGHYGAEAPLSVDQGIRTAAHDHAFDVFDTLDIDSIDKELKDIADAKNKEESRSRRKLYIAEKPLQFMSLDDLVELYTKHIGKKDLGKQEGKDERVSKADNRRAFVNSLTQEQQNELATLTYNVFKQEVKTASLGRRKATGTDQRGERAKKIADAKKAETNQALKDTIRQAWLTPEEADRIAEKELKKDIKEEEAFLKKQQKEANKEYNKIISEGVEKKGKKSEENKTTNKKEKTTAEKRIESLIKDNEDVGTLLNELAQDEYSYTGKIANRLSKLLSNLKLTAKVHFGTVAKGNDGKFTPSTNNITILGKDGQYTGQRSLTEVVLHEVMHYLTDHVIDNREAYIESLPKGQQAEVSAAINRLRQNYLQAVHKLGKSFNIPTIKEFIAEAFSNPEFQVALVNMDRLTPAQLQKLVNEGVEPKEYKPATKDNAFIRFVKNIAQALGISPSDIGVTYKEILEDIVRIVSLPSKEMRGEGVSYATQTIKALNLPDANLDNPSTLGEYQLKEKEGVKEKGWVKKTFMTAEGWRNIATKFENARAAIRSWEKMQELGGKIVHDKIKDINNVYTQITNSTGITKDLLERRVNPIKQRLNTAIADFAKANNFNTKDAMAILQAIGVSLHEEERRMVKWIMGVPLKADAAKRRQEIIGDRENGVLGEIHKGNETRAKVLWYELRSLAEDKNNHDQAGTSALRLKGETLMPTDINNPRYDVAGVDMGNLKNIRNQYNAKSAAYKAQVEKVMQAMRDMHDVTKALDKESGYWSQPVSNLVAAYDFKNYVPLKGKNRPSTVLDEAMDFDSKLNGSEMQDIAYAFGGRQTPSDNVILQTMSDATRAAGRAGRKYITLAVRNAVQPPNGGPKLIQGSIKNIKFEERNKAELRKGPNTIFHYNQDGSIDVISIDKKDLLSAIRRTYKDSNPIIDLANDITGVLGRLHTKYNYAFAPLNFVRDILTNSFTIGAEMGPVQAAMFIRDISASVAQGGLYKAAKVTMMYQNGKFGELDAYVRKDPLVRSMVDYITQGGKVSYIDGLSLSSNLKNLLKSTGKNGIMKTKEQVDNFAEVWTEMFELASRSAAYGLVKQRYVKEGMTEQAAADRATAYVKNLANFENVGEHGKILGALYMFARPAATGAVRAIESLLPAVRSFEQVKNSLPANILTDEAALNKARAAYELQQKYARQMVGVLIGSGMALFAMSAMMAPDDELDRNKTMTDNMQQWTRYARFHIPDSWGLGKDIAFQIPWGFGLGAFAAAGAQIASAISGGQSVSDAMANIVTSIALDSFLPIPISKMSAKDDTLEFILDSVAPSMARPILEFVINKNGLGQAIYSDSNRRFGDALVGGDRIPEVYKDLTRWIFAASGGDVDINPNSMYFFANSYADGISRFIETGNGIYDIASGDSKEFNAHTDLMMFNSFFGTRSNVDSREFSSIEKQILTMEKKYNEAKTNPEIFADYNENHPYAAMIIKSFNHDVGGNLKKLRTKAKETRVDPNLDKGEREDRLRMITLQQNLIKHNIVEKMKGYDLEP